MFDAVKATLLVEKLTALQTDNPELNYIQTINLSEKKKWDNQIIGCYDLIFPYLHRDYPTRDDVYEYMTDLFRIHHSMNYHKYTPNYTTVMPIFMRDPATIIGLTNYLESGKEVRRNSPVNRLGYGI